MRGVVGAGVCAVLLAASSAAWACEGSVGLLNDSFDSLSSIWDGTTKMDVADGAMEVTSRPDKSEKIVADPKFNNVDVCADVVLTDSDDLAAAYVGVGFWLEDNKNLYTFQITLDGYAGVYRLKDDKWETLIKDKASSSIINGTDSVNTVRVVTSGNKATFYINGDKFGSLVGSPPDGGSHVGFVVEGPAKKEATFRFNDIDVTYPE